MFGEYIPLVNALPFLKWFSPVGSGFTPGTAAGDFTFSEPDFKATTLICFEDAFPLLARAAVTAETDLIINLTNDGWFGESAAQWQHAVTAAFRAVENGIPLVRSTNNGLTCWVDAHGNVHEVYFGDSEDVYAAGFKVATIPLRRTPRTLFHRYGDWLGTCCFLMTFLHLAFNMVQEIRARRNRMPKA